MRRYNLSCHICNAPVERGNVIPKVRCFKCKSKYNRIFTKLRYQLKNNLITNDEYLYKLHILKEGTFISESFTLPKKDANNKRPFQQLPNSSSDKVAKN